MPVIKKEKVDLNQVSQTRIQEITEAAKTEEETKLTTEAAKPTAAPVKAVEPAPAPVIEKPVKQKEEQINFKLPQDVKIKWKKFFIENNINITQGIIFAVENLIQEVTDGEATLTMGGVYKKK